LPARTSTSTTEFLRLHPPRVCYEERSIVRHELLLQLDCAESINVFGEVRDDSLGNGLTYRIDLRRVSTSLDAHSHIDIGKGFFSRDENRLVNLESKDFWLDKVDG
jgi:hypothetical protein